MNPWSDDYTDAVRGALGALLASYNESEFTHGIRYGAVDLDEEAHGTLAVHFAASSMPDREFATRLNLATLLDEQGGPPDPPEAAENLAMVLDRLDSPMAARLATADRDGAGTWWVDLTE